MHEDVYEKLANALDRLANGFSRTESRIEIILLKRIFSPEEAFLASELSGKAESADEISQRVGITVKEAVARLIKMAKRGLVWLGAERAAGKYTFRLAPFIVGIYEAQLENIDRQFAHLFEEYMVQGGAVGIMKPQPALHRVIPVQNSVKSEWILPYDDVRAILTKAKTFRVRDCICRVEQEKLGRRQCDFPKRNCLNFYPAERPAQPGDITREEALQILEKAEEVGLVHTVSNVIEGIFYLCNCCGCCCGILRAIHDYGIENSVACANYYSIIDPDKCNGCGTCIERCQVHAIMERDGDTVVEKHHCIGCGLCVTGCPEDAVRLERKPDAHTIHPPRDFSTWERERLRNRGLLKEIE